LFYDDEFGEITQNKGHYAVEGHSRSPILVQIDLPLVFNTNLPPILHRFRDIAFNRSKIAIFRIFATPLAFNPADAAVSYIVSPEVIFIITPDGSQTYNTKQ